MEQKSIEEFQIFQVATAAREFRYLRGTNWSQSVITISRRFKDDQINSVIAVFYFSRYALRKLALRTTETRAFQRKFFVRVVFVS